MARAGAIGAGGVMEALWRDLRYAVRQLSRDPGFAVVAVLTLTLGIGGTTAVFTFVNALLLQPLPVAHSEQLVWIGSAGSGGQVASSFSYPDYIFLTNEPTGVSALAAFGLTRARLGRDDQAPMGVGAVVSHNYFTVLGVRPQRGRAFGSEEVAGEPVVIVSHDAWVRRFGSDPRIVGRVVQVNGHGAEVVGVAPEGFGGTIGLVKMEFWIPLSAYPLLYPGEQVNTRNHRWLQLVGRLAPGVRRQDAQARFAGFAPAIFRGPAYQTERPSFVVEPLNGLNGAGRRGASGVSALLLATALLVLGIASVNVVGMLLARNARRRREVAVRLAVGAGARRLVQQLLTESVLLWLAGGVGGLLLALALGRLFPSLVPVPEAFPAQLGLHLGIDARVLAFALAVSLFTGVGFGLLPALQAARFDVVGALKDSGHAGGRRSRFRGMLVVAQVALSVVLLVTAGLLLHALRRAAGTDPGFDPDGVTVAQSDLSSLKPDRDRLRQFHEQAIERLGRHRELEAASLASSIPLVGASNTTRIELEGHGPFPVLQMEVGYASVTPGYFRTLRIPLVRGRGFTDQDRHGAPTVAIMNEAMAARFWPRENVIGKVVRQGTYSLEVVGVAANVQDRDLGTPGEPMLYVPFAQQPVDEVVVLVRSPASAARSVVAELKAIDPELAPSTAQSYREMILAAMPQRLLAPVLGGFGVLGLVLAAVGIYGLIAYFTIHRTREFGIRMALGARPAGIFRMVVAQGMGLVALGIACGGVLALGIARRLGPLLAGGSRADPVTFAVVPALLLLVGFLAAFLPARRATRIDPVAALRAE